MEYEYKVTFKENTSELEALVAYLKEKGIFIKLIY